MKQEGRENTNIGYWEQVLQSPSPAYRELFVAEQSYLSENINPDTKVLDVGCLDGRNITNILRNTKFVIGVDNDKKAIYDAKESFKNVSGVEFIQASAQHLPFKSEAFDTVTLLMILPNFDQIKLAALRESARVLKDDGFIILSTFAETAFKERLDIYKKLKAPIEKIDGTKVFFDRSLGANVSEQFSKEQLQSLGDEAGLRINDCHKTGTLAYICKFVKANKQPHMHKV